MDKISSLFRFFIRSHEAGHFLEKFLIAAVSTILVIRFFLQLTNYPQIGGGGFHIAHVLWGGLLMLVAIFFLLVFLNKEAKDFSAIVGGIGFGAFIDEIGKFITAKNDYFFEPAIALMYVIFIILFLIFRSFERQKKLTPREYLINALEATKEVVVHDLDEKEKNQALRFLNHADQNDPVTKMLRELFEKLKDLPEDSPSIFSHLRRRIHRIYVSLVENNWFTRVVIGIFIVTSVFAVVRIIVRIPFFIPNNFEDLGFLIFSAVSGVFVIIGIYLSQRSRLLTYQMFKRAVLISIFFTQFFLFVEDQLGALLGLGFNIFMLLILDYLITEEKQLEKD